MCPHCGGPGNYLGCLGKLHWYRCRNCGVDFESEQGPEEEETCEE